MAGQNGTKISVKNLSNGWFLLLPTEYEIFGMVLLEAMYYKTVVLTTQNGGSSTLIQNGLNGYIMQIENGWEWANTILSILTMKEKWRRYRIMPLVRLENFTPGICYQNPS